MQIIGKIKLKRFNEPVKVKLCRVREKLCWQIIQYRCMDKTVMYIGKRSKYFYVNYNNYAFLAYYPGDIERMRIK